MLFEELTSSSTTSACHIFFADAKHLDRPILNNKCGRKAPKKVHKSEREKRKKDKQNDLF